MTIALFAAFAIALFGTGLVRRIAVATQLLDVPNARSSHATPTPRGGGLAVVIGTVTGWAVASHAGLPMLGFATLVAGGAVVATVGFLDDKHGLSSRLRLIAHSTAAAGLVAGVTVPIVPMLGGAVDLGAVGYVLAWFAVVWSINSFNFMDGTDGIATAQAVFVFGAATVIGMSLNEPPGRWAIPAVCAAASMGFLVWNFPPARIFMGDVGSGFLGFVIAAAALACSAAQGVTLWTWFVLHAAFVVDSTVTLLRRAVQRRRLDEAHRSHTYQILARRWASHRAVLAAFGLTNVLWLLPLAFLTTRVPQYGMLIGLVSVTPLAIVAVALGAGVAERGRSTGQGG
jgi:Fuc2NAc and GlcNAc transferase